MARQVLVVDGRVHPYLPGSNWHLLSGAMLMSLDDDTGKLTPAEGALALGESAEKSIDEIVRLVKQMSQDGVNRLYRELQRENCIPRQPPAELGTLTPPIEGIEEVDLTDAELGRPPIEVGDYQANAQVPVPGVDETALEELERPHHRGRRSK
jgi:hypothetical protein